MTVCLPDYNSSVSLYISLSLTFILSIHLTGPPRNEWHGQADTSRHCKLWINHVTELDSFSSC